MTQAIASLRPRLSACRSVLVDSNVLVDIATNDPNWSDWPGRALMKSAELPWGAGFLAGKCFLMYRRRGGLRNSPLPDFYIGAHAAIEHLALLTRDVARYRSYFPNLEILAPTKRQM